MKFKSGRYPYREDGVKSELSFNSNPHAKFYDLYDKSPLYSLLNKIDRHNINGRTLTFYLESQEVGELRKKHNVNVGLSDLLPLNRPVPDSRPDG